MSNPNSYYYIGTGEKCGFYTLHHVAAFSQSIFGFEDTYIQNLSTDWDTAYAKARKIAGTVAEIDAEPFQLDEIGQMRGAERWKMILKFKDPEVLPFGKYAGENVFDVINSNCDSDYVWWMVNAICKGNRKDENIPFMVRALCILDDLSIEDPAVVREREYEERKKRDAELDALASPVPYTKERLQITGTVLSTKWSEGYYGDTLKMLIRVDDGGYKLWGSVPSGLDREVERGDRVSFIAKVECSDDDEKFGFFKRPTKAQILEQE